MDIGQAKKLVGGRTWMLCSTPDYLAPEVIKNAGHGRGVDLWSLGTMIYEMLGGAFETTETLFTRAV